MPARNLPIIALILLGRVGVAGADTGGVRCDDVATGDYAIDGLLDDWGKQPVVARAGGGPDAAIALRCAWDGAALAVVLDVTDDRVVRTKPGSRGHEDHVAIAIDRTQLVDAYPGTAIARAKLVAAPRVHAADSLQPHGFSVEALIPASAIAGLGPNTPSVDLRVTFHDADLAAGGDDADLALTVPIVFGDRADLLDDFLKTTHLRKADLRLDQLAELDPDRKGKERVVAGGAVIGVLTDKFAYVAIPIAKPADMLDVRLLPLGSRGQSVIAATVRQFGNGGSRDLLMLWTVWGGQLSPLAQIEVRKQLGANVLESGYRIVPGAKPELRVEPKAAVGFTAETWNEDAADDADAIVPPWDGKRGGIAYTLKGAEVVRRDLPRHHR